MNNCTMGGENADGSPWTYYETLGGGMGAHPQGDGFSGAHVHMSNTLNTPVEALEMAYPLRLTRYHLRRGSGGDGTHRGGDGIVRELRDPAADNGHHPQRTPCHCPLGPGRRGTGPRPAAISSSIPTAPKKSSPPKSPAACSPASACASKTPGGGGWGVLAGSEDPRK